MVRLLDRNDVLQTQILELIENPQKITDAGRVAIETAKQRPWSEYEEELVESVAKYLD